MLLGLAALDLPLEPRQLLPQLAVLGLESGDVDRCRIRCVHATNYLFRRSNRLVDVTMLAALSERGKVAAFARFSPIQWNGQALRLRTVDLQPIARMRNRAATANTTKTPRPTDRTERGAV